MLLACVHVALLRRASQKEQPRHPFVVQELPADLTVELLESLLHEPLLLEQQALPARREPLHLLRPPPRRQQEAQHVVRQRVRHRPLDEPHFEQRRRALRLKRAIRPD